MTDLQKDTQTVPRARTRRTWWLLPLLVLFVLVGIIYVLVHMSSADSEMYPTTQLRSTAAVRLC